MATDSAGKNVITKGAVDVKFDSWYSLTLMARGTNVIGYIDMKEIFSTTVSTAPKNGFVGYGTNRFGYADFDNFLIEDDKFIPRYPEWL